MGGEWVSLALVVKTQGRRGEVAAELHSDVPERFRVGMRLWALLKDGSRRPVTVESLWPHKSWLVLKFAGVETISDAEALVRAELQVPLSERAELEPGWTYLSDLIGCVVFDSGREIGEIVDVRFGAGEAPLLVVRAGPAREKSVGEERKSSEIPPFAKNAKSGATSAGLPYEIPFAEAYLENVDVARKQVRMRLPDGLLDVNGPVGKDGL